MVMVDMGMATMWDSPFKLANIQRTGLAFIRDLPTGTRNRLENGWLKLPRRVTSEVLRLGSAL